MYQNLKLFIFTLIYTSIFLNPINSYSYHLEKAYGGIWGNNGQAIKYFSNWMLLSKAISDKGGAMTMLEKLKSNEKWEVIIGLHMTGNFWEENDGVVIWITKTGTSKEFNPDSSQGSENFGFFQYDFKGYYIFIKPEMEKKRMNQIIGKYNKVIQINEYNQKEKQKASCSFDLQGYRDGSRNDEMPIQDFSIYLIYDKVEKTLKIKYQNSNGITPQSCADLVVKRYQEFFFSVSARSQKPVQVEIPSLQFTTDKEMNLNFITEDQHHIAPNIFKNIHYLRAMKNEDDHFLQKDSYNITSLEDWENNYNSTFTTVSEMQGNTFNSQTAALGNLQITSGELENILKYINTHNDLSKSRYKQAITSITRYIQKSERQHTYMGDHIRDLVDKVEKASVNEHITKTEKLLAAAKQKIPKILEAIKPISEASDNILQNFEKGMSATERQKKLIEENQKTFGDRDNHEIRKKFTDKLSDTWSWLLKITVFICFFVLVSFVGIILVINKQGQDKPLL